MPKPPGRLDRDELRWWRELWREPVAATWATSDRMLVWTLCRNLAAIEAAEVPPAGLIGQAQNAMASLALSPRGRAVLRIQSDDQHERPASGREQFQPGGARDPRRIVSLDRRRQAK